MKNTIKSGQGSQTSVKDDQTLTIADANLIKTTIFIN
jgi:hypothetical protein